MPLMSCSRGFRLSRARRAVQPSIHPGSRSLPQRKSAKLDAILSPYRSGGGREMMRGQGRAGSPDSPLTATSPRHLLQPKEQQVSGEKRLMPEKRFGLGFEVPGRVGRGG